MGFLIGIAPATPISAEQSCAYSTWASDNRRRVLQKVRHVVALLACHNRRDLTLACLASLFEQQVQDTDVDVILVDDGSTDGTAEASRAMSDKVDVLFGDGSLYWARAMALAEERAVERRPDYLLWLNDDVVLYRRALAILLAAAQSADDQIVVGSVIDPNTRLPTYGGLDRIDSHPLRYRLIEPTQGRPREVVTFNGNVVLVPRSVYLKVGGIDGGFSHAFADLDYGLRARALGIRTVVAGGIVGTCQGPPLGGTWRDPSLPLHRRYRLLLDRKGAPIDASARYLRRHAGRLWPLYLSVKYFKLPVSHAMWHLRRWVRPR